MTLREEATELLQALLRIDTVNPPGNEAVAAETLRAYLAGNGIESELLAQTPVDQLEVRERPKVVFRVSENTWIEAIVRYVVRPREASRIKTRLMPKLLAALNAEPGRAGFPRGDAR